MRMLIDQDWLRKKIKEDDEPEGCPVCGAIAGCCDSYPQCPGNPDFIAAIKEVKGD